MAGWFKCSPDGWAATVELIAGPWPDETVQADLAYWADKVSLGGKRPSRRQLQARWSRSEWDTRKLLSQSPPKALTVPSQNHPKPERKKANNSRKSSQLPPNFLPTSSQTSPHARLVSDTDTDTDTDKGGVRLELVEPVAVPKLDDVDTVWAVWRGFHPRCRVSAPKDVRKLVSALLKDENTAEGIAVMIEWCHAEGSWWQKRDALFSGAILKMEGSSGRMEQAAEWDRAGRGAIVEARPGKAAPKTMAERFLSMNFQPEEPRTK